MKKPFAVAAAVSCIMAAGCSSESAPASTPLEVPAGVSTSPSESYPDRIEIPNGILDLSSLAVRQAFGGLPAAVSAHKQGLVLVLDKSNIVHLGNGATQYDRSLGTGFKADASHMVTAGHVIAGADRSEVNCGDTDIYTPPLTGGNNTFQAHLTEAAGSYAPDYSTPDLGIATVESSDSNFTALPSIPLRPTNTPIAPGTKLYNTSYQPKPDGTVRNPAAADPAQREPNKTAGIVLGTMPGRTNEYVVVTGLTEWDDSEDTTRHGASGSPMEFSDGVAAGVVSAENTLPTDEFSQRFGYRVIGATAVSYTIMEAVSRADVDSLSAQAHACVPTP
jgi:hypothetical protein